MNRRRGERRLKWKRKRKAGRGDRKRKGEVMGKGNKTIKCRR
jgi:hypothetical protein